MALTTTERDWANSEIERIMNEEGEDCVDNYRAADLDDDAEMAEYEEAERHGCCGFFSREVVHPETGKRILIGCNYGH